MSESEAQKPALTVDLTGPDGNVYFMVAKACRALEQAGQRDEANSLHMWFFSLRSQESGVSYDDVRHVVEQLCDVTWLHESPRSSAVQKAGVSPEYSEAEVIVAIATSRQPGRSVKEIRPGFYSDERETNYVWFVLLEPTGDPLENTVTTVDTNNIRAWQQQHQNPGFSGDMKVE